ncbi:hypothetical protein DUI87_14108 [Hirundo rustica rustica]|uniref:Uncharacterized protein n=1 Tax=Hirundo rustica rustica TaxID=333673 RepID=A0A3M0K7N0_HIRRU|nr:hypothetical protein DUI87_14108 [Hirundo rustica rustica]
MSVLALLRSSMNLGSGRLFWNALDISLVAGVRLPLCVLANQTQKSFGPEGRSILQKQQQCGVVRNFPWVLKLKAWLTPKDSAAQPACAQLPSDPSPPSTTSSGKVFHSEQEQQGFVSGCPGWLGAIVFAA